MKCSKHEDREAIGEQKVGKKTVYHCRLCARIALKDGGNLMSTDGRGKLLLNGFGRFMVNPILSEEELALNVMIDKFRNNKKLLIEEFKKYLESERQKVRAELTNNLDKKEKFGKDKLPEITLTPDKE